MSGFKKPVANSPNGDRSTLKSLLSSIEADKPLISAINSTGNYVIGNDIVAELSSTILIDCIATGEPEPTIQWTKSGSQMSNGGRINIFRNGTLKITRTSSRDSGKYACTATNTGGSADRTSAVTIGGKLLTTADRQ